MVGDVSLEVGSDVAVHALLHVPGGRVVLAKHLVLGVVGVHDQQVRQVMQPGGGREFYDNWSVVGITWKINY